MNPIDPISLTCPCQTRKRVSSHHGPSAVRKKYTKERQRTLPLRRRIGECKNGSNLANGNGIPRVCMLTSLLAHLFLPYIVKRSLNPPESVSRNWIRENVEPPCYQMRNEWQPGEHCPCSLNLWEYTCLETYNVGMITPWSHAQNFFLRRESPNLNLGFSEFWCFEFAKDLVHCEWHFLQLMLCNKKFFQIHNLQQPNMGGHRPCHPPIIILDLQIQKNRRICYIYFMSGPWISFHFLSFHQNFTQPCFLWFPFVSFQFLLFHPQVNKNSPNKSCYAKKNFFQIGNLQQTKMEGHRPFHPPIMSLMDKCPKIQRIHYIYLMSCPCNVLSFPLSSAKISFHFVSYHPKFTQNSFNEFCFHFLSFPFISPKIHPKFIQLVLLSFPFISFHITQNSPKIHSTSCAFISFHFLSYHPKFTQNSPKIHSTSLAFIYVHFLSYHPKFTQNSPKIHSTRGAFIYAHFLSFPFISPKIHPKFIQL